MLKANLILDTILEVLLSKNREKENQIRCNRETCSELPLISVYRGPRRPES